MAKDKKTIEEARRLRAEGQSIVEKNVLTKAKATITMMRNTRMRLAAAKRRKAK